VGNPQQMGNRFAHRPELKDLGKWFYVQRNRINMRWNRSVRRVERAKRLIIVQMREGE
jgi:hypothetical protein